MTPDDIHKFKKRVSGLIAQRRLREAFVAMADMCHRRMAWEVGDKLEKTEKAYAYMLSYVARGVDDPERATVYDSIVSDLYLLLDSLVRFMEKNEAPTLYYNILRTSVMPGRKIDIPAVLSELALNPTDSVRRNAFASIWVSYPLSTREEDAILASLSSEDLSPALKIFVINALMLGMMNFYDPRRLGIIIRTYMGASDAGVKAAALVSTLLSLWWHRDRPLDRRTANIIDAAKDNPQWFSHLRTAFIEIIRTRNTERINRKMMDEVIPKMINLRPDIMKKIRDGKINPEDPASMQENPEWQEMLDKSGITDKLKELTEMQQEGGDVFMSTFANLKNFPFFSEISNWFLPFIPDLPEVKAAMSGAEAFNTMLENAIYLCDSDKYSFAFALQHLPAVQREMMTSQLAAQSDTIAEMSAQIQNEIPQDVLRYRINSYHQNIYRFFKLYSRKEEFADPFADSINLIRIPALEGDFTDAEMLQVVAEFYFRSGYYEDALEAYDRLEDITPGDSQRYQKMGYCCEKTGNLDSAIEYYHRAELLDGTSLWTQRRLAATLRSAGHIDEALERYRKLCETNPENVNFALQYGYILTEKGNYPEAVNQFYKVEFLDEKSSRAWRPLAWTLFLTHNFDAAQMYYEKILGDNPTPGDYLNMGHTAAARNNLRDAINNYTLSLQASGGDREKFLADLKADANFLKEAGISDQTISLLADTVFYSLDK